MSGSGRGNMVAGLMGSTMAGGHIAGRGEGSQYEMYDAEMESHSGSGAASSVGTCYEDAHSDAYDGRAGELAFGDRIY